MSLSRAVIDWAGIGACHMLDLDNPCWICPGCEGRPPRRVRVTDCWQKKAIATGTGIHKTCAQISRGFLLQNAILLLTQSGKWGLPSKTGSWMANEAAGDKSCKCTC